MEGCTTQFKAKKWRRRRQGERLAMNDADTTSLFSGTLFDPIIFSSFSKQKQAYQK